MICDGCEHFEIKPDRTRVFLLRCKKFKILSESGQAMAEQARIKGCVE